MCPIPSQGFIFPFSEGSWFSFNPVLDRLAIAPCTLPYCYSSDLVARVPCLLHAYCLFLYFSKMALTHRRCELCAFAACLSYLT